MSRAPRYLYLRDGDAIRRASFAAIAAEAGPRCAARARAARHRASHRACRGRRVGDRRSGRLAGRGGGRARGARRRARRCWSTRAWSRPGSRRCRAATASSRRSATPRVPALARSARHDALGRRGRAVAAASRRRRRAPSATRRPRSSICSSSSPQGAPKPALVLGFPGRLCRRRRGQGGARRKSVRAAPSSRFSAGAAAARWRRPRSTRWRGDAHDAVARRRRHRRGRARPRSRRPRARSSPRAETLVGGARHLALVPAGRAERIPWREPHRRDASPTSRRGAAGASSCWRAAIRCATASAAMLRPRFRARGDDRAARARAPSRSPPRGSNGRSRSCVAISLHGRPLEALRLHLAPGARILALTTDGATPARAAALLREAGWGPSVADRARAYGRPARAPRRRHSPPIGDEPVADLNLLAIECRPGPGARA